MRKAMKNTIFGTALVAGLMMAGTAANAQRPGFEGRGYNHPAVHEGFAREGYAREGFVHPVGPAYPVARHYGAGYGFGVTVGAPAYAGSYGDTYADNYIPPCPGDGYEWAAGYYNGGAWIPGAWRLRAGFVDRSFAYNRGYDHGFGHGERGFDHRGYGRR
jgi:hypothetical protein